MVTEKEKEDFNNSIHLLGSYLKHYEAGDTLMYLSMATELRKLLCEKDPSPLLTRIIPGVQLYQLQSTKLFGNNPNLLEGLENFIPGSLDTKTHPPRFTLGFSGAQDQMDLNPWLDQMIFKEGITIRKLIKSVADKEGAHADPKYNDTLLHGKNWTFNDTGSHILGIYAISRFIYDFVNKEHSESLV